MLWVDVCGPPGSGKSTLCDPLWGPNDIDFEGVGQFHPAWGDFLRCCDRLLKEVREHPTIEAMRRMLWRSLRKIAVVECIVPPNPMDVYIQTALAQRGLGFGWRLHDLGKTERVREYFELMPVSLGVAMTKAPIPVIEERNRLRETVKATAHENRSEMVAKMQPAMQIAREVFGERRIPFVEIDTTVPIGLARIDLLAFASTHARNAASLRPGSQVETVPLVA